MSVANDLEWIIQTFEIPPALREPCLVPTDFAFRNVMYDPKTQEITGFLDFDDAAILPAVLIPHYPEDLVTDENPSMMDEKDLTMQHKIVGNWSSLEDKPRGYYKGVEKDRRSSEFDFHLSDLEPFVIGTKDSIFQLMFSELLRLWDFPQQHNSDEDGPLSTPSPCCVDAQKIHRLVQGSFLTWGRNRRWISDKAEELRKPASV